jgi:hypothetical protein
MGSTPKGISGSRAATVLGLNPWSTPFEVWQLIMEERTPGFNAERGYEMPAPVDNAAVRWGTAFEDALTSLASGAYGANIIDREREFNRAHGDVELTCHVDGLVLDAVHEAKTTTEFGFRAKWGEPGSDKIPRHYGVQVQHNMMLSERERALVAVLCFPKAPKDWEDEGWSVRRGNEWHDKGRWYISKADEREILTQQWATVLADMGYFHTYEVHADPELHLMMLDRYTEWWHKYVIPGVPPEPMNVEDIQRRIPNPSGTIVVENPQVVAWMKEYSGIKSEIGSGGTLQKRLDQLKELILAQGLEGVSAVDKDTTDKWIFRGADGDKLASWSKSAKTGNFTFRVSA